MSGSTKTPLHKGQIYCCNFLWFSAVKSSKGNCFWYDMRLFFGGFKSMLEFFLETDLVEVFECFAKMSFTV